MLVIKSHWEQVNTDNLIFNFLKVANFSSRDKENFISKRETTYYNISNLLQITIELKITYFVFPTDRNICLQYMPYFAPNQALAGLFMIFSRINQSSGHELTHVLSYYINNSFHYSYKILSEGLATWLDQSSKDHHQMASDLVAEGEIIPFNSIIGDSNFKAVDARITYPQCASFVGFLLDNYGIEKFKSIWVKEDLRDKIKHVYGKELENLELQWHKFLDSYKM